MHEDVQGVERDRDHLVRSGSPPVDRFRVGVRPWSSPPGSAGPPPAIGELAGFDDVERVGRAMVIDEAETGKDDEGLQDVVVPVRRVMKCDPGVVNLALRLGGDERPAARAVVPRRGGLVGSQPCCLLPLRTRAAPTPWRAFRGTRNASRPG